jgi:translation initiation factor IF-3
MGKDEYFRINEKIKSPKVRLVGDGIKSKIVDLREALDIAGEKNLDLVEIVPKSKPPVCKVVDFNKFLYERKQKEKEQEKMNRKNAVKVKDLRFTYNTGDHDFNFKLNHAKDFLEKGNKVKAFVYFSGREIHFQDQAKVLLLRFVEKLKDYGKIEQLPKFENKKMWVMINPSKK